MQDNKRKKRNKNFKRTKEREEEVKRKEEKRKEEIRKEQWVGWRCVEGRKLRMLFVKPISISVRV